MALLTYEDGLVKIGGEELPGELVDQSVDCRVRFDEQAVDGSSGKKRTPQGWEDTEVQLTLCLTTDGGDDGQDCYDKLKIIDGHFRAHDGNANPQIYEIDNRHLLARGVKELIFSGLSSAETDQDDTITAVLSFVENNPPVVKTEKAAAKSAQQKAAKSKAEKEAQQKGVTAPNVEVPAIDPSVEIDLN